MSSIVLTTLNAKYIHTSFGLRYIYANLQELQSETSLIEFEINTRPHDIAEKILTHSPRIIGIGVYIWNVKQVKELISILKRVSPQTCVIVGGPEVSYDTENHEIYPLVDYIIQGEADHTFRDIARLILRGDQPSTKIIASPLPNPATIQLPYQYYQDTDIAHRVVYVEASRGCPFTCEFCLSSLEVPVRQFDLEPFLKEMDALLARGLRQFKFVDRTFNLHLKTSRAILEFFLERYTPGLFIHFEMVPDRLPEQLREIIAKFPHGALQFEIGIQSFNPEVGKLISRRQDFTKLADNIRYLRAHTGVHIHADLIAGLPGETYESFAEGFNTLIELNPQEIQVGILKRLRGTPIIRHDTEWEMAYNPYPPYELLSNNLIPFHTMQRLGRFSRFWDLVGNSGNFKSTRSLLLSDASGAFDCFMSFCDWMYQKTGARHGYSLKNLAELLFEYLTTVRALPHKTVIGVLTDDFARLDRKDKPRFLQNATSHQAAPTPYSPQRQLRHSAG